MGEAFHRRGHHVQKAHGHRVHLASDGSHLSGGMIALMPTPEDAKRLAIPGGEKAAELHCTLFFLGDDETSWTDDQRNELEAALRAMAGGLTPVPARVFGAAHWNGDGDKPSWVWSVGDDPEAGLADSRLQEVRSVVQDALGSIHERPETPEQHSPWVAHICAAYTEDSTLLKALEKRLGPVTFDRIRLSFGDDDRDIPLTATAVNLTASGLRREPLPQEAHCDFAEHNRQWEDAVQRATGGMNTVYAGWRAQLKSQITSLADEPGDLTALSVTPGDAEGLLTEIMITLARRSGQALQREAEKQGIAVPEWSLPDDVVTAAVGGRKLLRSVARMTADLMASSVVQAAKRRVTGMFAQNSSPEEIAADVDRTLDEAEDGILRGPVGTAMSTAQTAGRQAVLEAAPPGEYYASEMLDKNTCAPCRAVDGEQFGSLEIAVKAYPVMGYKDCAGPRYGNACRGMIVASWTPEGEVQTASAATIPSDTVMIGEGTMPWHKVHGHSGCAAGQWAVVKDSDSSVSGCHDTEAQADDQLAALYASEGDHTVTTETLKTGKPPGSDCPPGTAPDKDTGECAPVETMTTETELEMGGETAPWRGPLTVEGIETGDGREFDAGSLTWADLPLPLRWNKEDSHGGQPHTVAVNVGRIDKIWREDSGLIMGEGLLDLSDDDGRKVYGKIEGKFLRGVSVDVDSVKDADMELVWAESDPEGDGESDLFDQLFASPEKVVFHKGRIRAATLVDIPAFAEAYIALLDGNGAVVAGGEPVGALRAARVPARSLGTGGPRDASWLAPADWFTDPGLSVPTPVTITPEGQVYGHAALWGTCHIGQTGVCVTPPHEDGHPYFMTGAVSCRDGALASVGQITVGTGHAPLDYGHRAASEHYDNTGSAVADVSVGNDIHGIWIAGSIRPGADPSRVHELRAAGQVSGDWRRIGGQLRLVGLLAVNVPGFPVPKLSTRYALGQQLALVAAGAPDLVEHLTEDDLDQIAYRRVMDKLTARVHGER
jgi:2'-5' RNA ligase